MTGPVVAALLLGARAIGAVVPLVVLATAILLVALASMIAWGAGRAHSMKVLKELVTALTAFSPKALDRG